MSNFKALVKVQFLSLFGINKRLHDTKKKFLSGIAGTILYGVIVCAAIGYAGYTYANLFAEALLLNGEIISLLPLMAAVCAIISFVFSFFATGNVLYAYKDYDLLSSMPVRTSDIVLSKLLFIYVSDLAFSIIIMVPSLIVYANIGGELGAVTIIALFLILLFTPLLMMALSVLVGMLTSVVSSLFRRKNLIQIILLLIVMGAYFWLCFAAGSGNADFTAVFKNIYFLFPLSVRAMSDLWYALLFVAVNVASFALVTALVCVTYKKFNSIITAKRTKKNFRMKIYEGQNVFSSLYRRETSRLFSCPMYFLNSIIGAALCVVMAVVAVVVADMLVKQQQELADILGSYIAVFTPAAFSFMLILAPTTNCAISLEGSAFWIIKTVPVKMNTVFKAKLAVNYTYFAISALISSAILVIFIKMSVLVAVLVFANGLIIASLGGNAGLLINILLPKMKWENENQVVKQSASVLVTMLSAFVFAILFGLGAAYIPLSAEWLLIITGAFSLLCTAASYVVIMTKGESILDRKI